MTDARETAGATDPDPGCSGPNDTTENSDGDLMEDCEFEAGPVQGDPRFLYLAVRELRRRSRVSGSSRPARRPTAST